VVVLDQMNIFEFLDTNLSKLQSQLPFAVVHCNKNWEWTEQGRQEWFITNSSGQQLSVMTTLNLMIVDSPFAEINRFLTYECVPCDQLKSGYKTLIFNRGQLSAYCIDWLTYRDLS